MKENERTEAVSSNESNVENHKNGSLTYKLVLTALFTALATITNAYVTVRVGALFKFSPLLVIYFFAGYYLGAPLGFLVGAIGDVLGWVLFTDGAYNPLIGLSNGLSCALPALLFGFKRPMSGLPSHTGFILRSFLGYLVCYLCCTVFLTSLGIWLYTSYIQGKYVTLFAWFLYRAGAQAPNNVCNYVITVLLYFPLCKIKSLNKLIA